MIINGWNRLLLVLSAAWLLLASLWIFANYPNVTPDLAASPVNDPFFSVVSTGNSDSPFHISAHPLAMASYIVIPILLLWAFAGVVRWIRRGFRQDIA
jgi:hypothetical protein